MAIIDYISENELGFQGLIVVGIPRREQTSHYFSRAAEIANYVSLCMPLFFFFFSPLEILQTRAVGWCFMMFWFNVHLYLCNCEFKIIYQCYASKFGLVRRGSNSVY